MINIFNNIFPALNHYLPEHKMYALDESSSIWKNREWS